MDASQRLKACRLKVTAPRVRLLTFLLNSEKKHWRAEDLYQSLKNVDEEIGLATVYRILGQFEKVGLVNRHRFDGEHALFEFAEFAHHDHLVCVQCGKVEEFVDPIIEARQLEIAQTAGYVLTNHALNLYGFCQRCRD